MLPRITEFLCTVWFLHQRCPTLLKFDRDHIKTDPSPTQCSFSWAPASRLSASGSGGNRSRKSSYWPVREGVSVDYLPFTLSSEPWLLIYRHQGDPKNGKKLFSKSGNRKFHKARGDCKKKEKKRRRASKTDERLRSTAVRTSPFGLQFHLQEKRCSLKTAWWGGGPRSSKMIHASQFRTFWIKNMFSRCDCPRCDKKTKNIVWPKREKKSKKLQQRKKKAQGLNGFLSKE